jgi:hypothetical protein
VKREKGRQNVEFKSVRKMSGTMKDDTEKRVTSFLEREEKEKKKRSESPLALRPNPSKLFNYCLA